MPASELSSATAPGPFDHYGCYGCYSWYEYAPLVHEGVGITLILLMQLAVIVWVIWLRTNASNSMSSSVVFTYYWVMVGAVVAPLALNVTAVRMMAFMRYWSGLGSTTYLAYLFGVVLAALVVALVVAGYAIFGYSCEAVLAAIESLTAAAATLKSIPYLQWYAAGCLLTYVSLNLIPYSLFIMLNAS